VFPTGASLKFFLVMIIVPEVPGAPTVGIASRFNSSNTAACFGGERLTNFRHP
jgi:hypothetical protein